MNTPTKIAAVFQQRLTDIANDTEAALDRLLGPDSRTGERARPAHLMEAMRYSTLGGGKRFRPFLVVESAALFDVPRERAILVLSLIHI